MALEKIWLVNTKNSWTKGDIGEVRLARTENRLMSMLNEKLDQEVFEYELVSKTEGQDFIKIKDRDFNINAVIEDDDTNQIILDIIDGVARRYGKDHYRVKELSDKKYDKKSFKSYITRNKWYIFGVSCSVEWYKLLLSLGNFKRDESFSDIEKRTYDKAKEELKK